MADLSKIKIGSTMYNIKDAVARASAGGGGAEVTTWASLKSMRDGGTLTPGKFYRITDYVASTSQSGTASANKPFDIIVLATSNVTLAEEAWAALHQGDTYFANANPGAWELKYSLDNDTARFAWASASGKGVVWHMKDEYGNECGYDFKGIKINGSFTFGNASYDRSLNGGCRGNVIRPYLTTGGKRSINKVRMGPNGCVGNTFGVNCHDITLGDTSTNNTFGSGCYSISASEGAVGNSFGERCSGMKLDSYCEANTFGNDCHGNTLGNGCTANNFAARAYKNTLGASCRRNRLGEGVHHVHIKDTVECTEMDFTDNVTMSSDDDGTTVWQSHCKLISYSMEGTKQNPVLVLLSPFDISLTVYVNGSGSGGSHSLKANKPYRVNLASSLSSIGRIEFSYSPHGSGTANKTVLQAFSMRGDDGYYLNSY